VFASANVQPLRDLVAAGTEAHTAGVIKIIFLAYNDDHSSHQPRAA
jgi:hypothetical protein